MGSIIRRSGHVAAVVALVLLAAPVVTAGASEAEPPEPPPPPVAPPEISPTECIGHPAETADDYNQVFGGSFGVWQAGDSPHHYPLPDGRTLWILNDSFLETREPGGRITDESTFVHNAGVIEDDGCFTLLNTVETTTDDADADGFFDQKAHPFFPDRGPGDWYWPLGGVVQGSHLLVYLAHMTAPVPLSWELRVTAREVMVASFDWRTLALEGIQRAPDPAVGPVYGFSVATDCLHTYIFGNNFVYGQHTSSTYLARVPAGGIGTSGYEYWTGETWSPSRSDARPVHDPGGYSYAFSVAYVAGRWYAVTKVDEFFGDQLDLLHAPGPTGPWTVATRVPVSTKQASGQNTYGGELVGRLNAGGRIVAYWSNNNFTFAPVATDPWLYRPTFADLQLPRSMLRHLTRAAASPAPRILSV